MYGLPLGCAPGSTEALIQQQSNSAYTEFRKQMLTQTQSVRGRNKGTPSGLRSDISPTRCGSAQLKDSSGFSFGLQLESKGNSSSGDESLSGPDSNTSCNGNLFATEKNGNGKSERQVKIIYFYSILLLFNLNVYSQFCIRNEFEFGIALTPNRFS